VQATLDALFGRTRTAIAGLAESLADGALDPRGFGDALVAALEGAHTEAVVIGRHHAGDLAPPEADDATFAGLVVDGEAEYLARFVEDLESGRYTDQGGNWKVGAIAGRAQMYGAQLVRTANEVWALTLPETTLFYWHASKDEGSCSDCPDRETGSPYRQEDLPEWGSGECLTNCRCSITTGSGREGFTLPAE
jgi:hypothetical protein